MAIATIDRSGKGDPFNDLEGIISAATEDQVKVFEGQGVGAEISSLIFRGKRPQCGPVHSGNGIDQGRLSHQVIDVVEVNRLGSEGTTEPT